MKSWDLALGPWPNLGNFDDKISGFDWILVCLGDTIEGFGDRDFGLGGFACCVAAFWVMLSYVGASYPENPIKHLVFLCIIVCGILKCF